MSFSRAKDLAKQYLQLLKRKPECQSLDLAQSIPNHAGLSGTSLQLKMVLLNGGGGCVCV